MKAIVDIESDGLLDTVTKIYIVGWINIETGKSGTIVEYSEMIRFFNQKDLTIIGHNFIRFDKPLVEKILEIDLTCRIVDSLALSWYLYPKRLKHGLGEWGEYFGVPKVEVENWENQDISLMQERVVEDCKINLLLFKKQLSLLNKLYDNNPKEIKRLIGYLGYKLECSAEQEKIKWKLDVEKCTSSLITFENEFERRRVLLTEIMPEHILYKTLKKPKKMYKKDESLSKLGVKWLSLLDEIGLDEAHDEPLKLEKTREAGNPGSHAQLKEWLFSLGWDPLTFKYEREDNGKMRKIPQISLPRGEGLCPSVKELYQVEPRLVELDMLFVVKHRVGILSGFLRDQKDGFLQAKIAGLTNTLRFKHSELVNLPGVTGKNDWRDGVHIREVLTANTNEILCGSDVSSLEDQTKKHLMYFFDPKFVKEMDIKGYDAHLALAEFTYAFTKGRLGISPEDIDFYKNFKKGEDKERYQRIKNERHIYKTLNYSSVYGVGAPTMSRSLGFPIRDCEELLEAYWSKNWAVKEIAKAVKIKTLGKQMWLQNPTSKFWYSLRAFKDRFSTCNQGLGVYIFDLYLKEIRKKGYKLIANFHDEFIVSIENKEDAKNKLRKEAHGSINNVNKMLKLNVKIQVDVQFGLNYAEIH